MGGVIDFIDQTNRENILYLFLLTFNLLSSSIGSFFSGGILGWDPVHTTCIPDEMMMR